MSTSIEAVTAIVPLEKSCAMFDRPCSLGGWVGLLRVSDQCWVLVLDSLRKVLCLGLTVAGVESVDWSSFGIPLRGGGGGFGVWVWALCYFYLVRRGGHTRGDRGAYQGFFLVRVPMATYIFYCYTERVNRTID